MNLNKMNKEVGANNTLCRITASSRRSARAQGEVYLAQDTKLGRKGALKILPSEIAANQDRLRRFKQDATAAAC